MMDFSDCLIKPLKENVSSSLDCLPYNFNNRTFKNLGLPTCTDEAKAKEFAKTVRIDRP